MTLFTAEGLLRASTRWHYKGICHVPSVIHHAYERWLLTQGDATWSPIALDDPGGWLIDVKGLHARRAPGRTCVSALSARTMGTMEEPLNHSKGCGGVMRVAPIGLLGSDARTAFKVGCEAAAITHGHPSGYYSAGAFAAIIHNLTTGLELPEAIEGALRILDDDRTNPGHEECSRAIRGAVSLAEDTRVAPSPESIEQLGRGWVGEEALAMALYAALSAQEDFARGVRLAVNHSGDSDSTGAICGNLLGLMLGVDAIPSGWRNEIELREEIETVADDLLRGFDESETWWARYPGF